MYITSQRSVMVTSRELVGFNIVLSVITIFIYVVCVSMAFSKSWKKTWLQPVFAHLFWPQWLAVLSPAFVNKTRLRSTQRSSPTSTRVTTASRTVVPSFLGNLCTLYWKFQIYVVIMLMSLPLTPSPLYVHGWFWNLPWLFDMCICCGVIWS